MDLILIFVHINAIKDTRNKSYKWSPFSVFAPEGHFDCVLVSCPLVKSLAGLKRGAVQVQTHCTLCVADIFHAMQTDGIWNRHEEEHLWYKLLPGSTEIKSRFPAVQTKHCTLL